jgi:M6 family metalloprotease-like protein
LNFPQEQGPEVRLRVFGDERYARYEDIDGYTMVYDKARGLFCYATLAGNRFASTGVPLDQPPPPPPPVVRHLRESLVVKRAKAEENRLLHLPPGSTDHHDVVRTFGPNQGLLNGRRLSIGKVRGLTILVNFRDVTSTTTATDVEEMLNGDNFTRNGNISSVREYFLRVSNGRLDYTNTVVGPFTLSQKREHYHDNLLVEEALQLAVDSGLNLNQFDSRNQGIVDAVNILYAGQSLHIDRSMLWPHNSTIDLRFGAMRTDLYLLTGLGRNAGELSIGTFCHENGHLLCRFPDMYDYGSIEREGDDRDSSGIGHYCLMGAGNHLDFGRSPSPVCAYLRDLAGWCDTVVDINTPDTYEAVHADYGTVMKYQASKPNEYFIVENRSKTGLDRAGPSNGLAVYHCDIFGSNELQQGTADHHYQCALLQADGRRDLEDNANQGDGSDLFGSVAGMAVSSTSRPHSREWDGRESGLVLSDFSVPGERIRFRAGQSTPSQTARGEQTPNLTIPDNRLGGVSSTIDVTVSGIVRRIRMTLDISHPFVSDLLVELLSPMGRRAVLHSRQGGSSDDLSRAYDSERPGGELSSLVGQPMQGPWVLRISDRARADVGTLRKWSIEVESASA